MLSIAMKKVSTTASFLGLLLEIETVVRRSEVKEEFWKLQSFGLVIISSNILGQTAS